MPLTLPDKPTKIFFSRTKKIAKEIVKKFSQTIADNLSSYAIIWLLIILIFKDLNIGYLIVFILCFLDRWGAKGLFLQDSEKTVAKLNEDK